MASIKTSNGYIKFKQHLLYLGNHTINMEVMEENLKLISECLDKIGINWGPAFGTLIGIVRNNNALPWARVFNLYILREDEERFKEVLDQLIRRGFRIVRHERRGLYYLERKKEYFKIFSLQKISPELRHTGGTDFIHEKYLQNTVKWEFRGIQLNVPVQLEEYLSFQYDEWYTPQEKKSDNSTFIKYKVWIERWIQDHLSDRLYYNWLRHHKKNDFKRFKDICERKGIEMSADVELSVLKPRKYKKVLTVGVYDVIHKGHVELYRRAKGLGDYLIVAVQDGEYILKYKPESKVLNSTEDRKYMVKSIRYVDETVTYTDVDRIIKEVDFDIFVTGPDQCHTGFQRAINWCEAHGKEHIVLGRTQGISSSELKAKMNKLTQKAK